LVKTKKQADNLKQQLNNVAAFDRLAKKHSLCKSSAKKGGYLGEFPPSRVLKAFDNVVFKKPLLTAHKTSSTFTFIHLVLYNNSTILYK
jgi:peptidyl-prolyl cis-trans isomerase C